MDDVQKLMNKVLAKRGLLPHAQASLVVHKAKTFLADRLPATKDFIRVTTLKDAELVIECANSIAAQECMSVREDLIAHLLAAVPGTPVRSARIVRE